jgi:hypothetical protein
MKKLRLPKKRRCFYGIYQVIESYDTYEENFIDETEKILDLMA